MCLMGTGKWGTVNDKERKLRAYRFNQFIALFLSLLFLLCGYSKCLFNHQLS